MATVTPSYSAKTAITFAVASTATSATFVAGRESTEVDNATTNKYIDAQVQGKVTVGTTPTVNTEIRIYVWGADTSLATTAIDVLDGTDSIETLTSAGIRNGCLKLAATLDVDATTSDRTYPVGIFSVAEKLGLRELPKFWGLFLTHNTGVNLNATAGNHEFNYTGIKYDVA